eukprot:m.40837 g.40837  ORF g.40837 m.40837 type:complete len:362 (-) comp9715_c0_seq1:4330-5415(-)
MRRLFSNWSRLQTVACASAVASGTITVSLVYADDSKNTGAVRAYEDGWWRSRDTRFRPGSGKKMRTTPQTTDDGKIRVAVLGDSITYGSDPRVPRRKELMPAVLAKVANKAGVTVDGEATSAMSLPTVTETNRIWKDLNFDEKFEGPSFMKQKLAVLANYYGIETGWGWPFPNYEDLGPQIKTPYPEILQDKLGDNFLCQNFGVPGVTLLNYGHNPFMARQEYGAALAFRPHIIIVNLGFNDANDWNWNVHGREFVSDYLQLIDSFRNKDGEYPLIFICIPTSAAESHPQKKELQALRKGTGGLDDSVRAVSTLRNTHLIDLSTVVSETALKVDGAHPDEQGATEIASAIHAEIVKVLANT